MTDAGFQMNEPSIPLLGASGLLAVSIEWIIILGVIAAISSFADWLKKRRQRDQAGDSSTDEWPTPATRTPPPVPPATDASGKPLSQWEEEIRRMLQGVEPEPPVPPPMPPPVVRPTMPPPRPYQSRPVVVQSEEGEADEPVPTHLSSIERPHGAYSRAATLEQSVDARLAKVSSMGTVAEAWNRVGSIDERVRERLREATSHRHSTVGEHVHKPRSEEATRLAAAFRSPVTARQAIVASFVLGPPKALEG